MTLTLQQQEELMKRAARASVGVALTLIVVKAVTFFITGSVAILSSLFDSMQDVMTSFVNMVAVRQSVEPADKEHRFGHGKAQALGSLIQAFIIAGAALFLLFESIDRFCQPQPLSHIGLGIGITVLAIIMTFVLIRFQAFVIRETESLSIKADRAHYAGDILMNVGVIIAMVLSSLTGWLRFDSIFGIGVTMYLFCAIYAVVKEAFKMLMDTELPPAVRKQIKELAYSFPEVLGVYQMKTRKSGSNNFVQFCIRLKNEMPLKEVHAVTDKIERKIQEQIPNAEVIIHPEPERNNK